MDLREDLRGERLFEEPPVDKELLVFNASDQSRLEHVSNASILLHFTKRGCPPTGGEARLEEHLPTLSWNPLRTDRLLYQIRTVRIKQSMRAKVRRDASTLAF